ncbi:MAG: M23 family metallopeptidase [Lachnospiraceae bacterium]|nr:M23 family metallopeptidase [Lachnospiraceae bacterium]
MEQDKPEQNKKKRFPSFHLMLFVDSESGRVRQMSINQETAQVLLGIGGGLFVALIVFIVCLFMSAGRNRELRDTNESLMADIASMETEMSLMDETISTQSGKITALSNTVNEKVAGEKLQEKEDEDAHIPTGFPLSASTSYTEPDENMIITFKADDGTSILASGSGTVTQVIADSVYGHCVVIDHGNGYSSVYRNGSDPMVKEGDEVDRGDILFITGTNTKSVAYNIYKDSQPVDPLTLMQIDG